MAETEHSNVVRMAELDIDPAQLDACKALLASRVGLGAVFTASAIAALLAVPITLALLPRQAC